MKERNPILEIIITTCLALLLGFFLAAGTALNGGGYLGFGVEHYASDVYISWHEPEIYKATLLYALLAYAVLFLLWRALDWISALRAQKILAKQAEAAAADADAAAADAAAAAGEADAEAAEAVAEVAAETATAAEADAEAAAAEAAAAAVSDTATNTPPKTVICIKKRWFWLAALALICCWVPFWLALWPGIFNYDAHYQYEMLVFAELQTHHPLAHTFLLDGIVLFGEHVLGDLNWGVALYIGLALIASALTYAWMLTTMAEEGAGKVLLVCSFLFFAINPAFVLWLVSTNKDVLFTVFLLLAALVLYRACRFRPWELALAAPAEAGQTAHGTAGRADQTVINQAMRAEVSQTVPAGFSEFSPENADTSSTVTPLLNSPGALPRTLRIGFTTALALFLLIIAVLALRTSAVYSLIVFLPFAALLIRKHLRIRLMSVLLLATVVFVVVYLLLTQLIFHIPSGPWQTLDALSIPRQQLARVWVQTNDSTETAAYEQVFSSDDLAELERYEADDADTSRSAFRESFEENPFGLLALYLEMGVAHPGTYTDAALLTSYEAWYPGAVIDGYVIEDYFAKPGVARSSYIDVSAFWPAEEDWILEDFGLWLKSFGIGNEGLDSAPVRFLCSPAVYMWLALIVLARTICVRNRRGALVCVLLLIFGATALLSPLVVMRYYLMVMAATPLLLHIAGSPSWAVRKKGSCS